MTESDPRTRARLWLRVSTDEQETEGQRAALLRMAAARGMTVVGEYDTEASAWTGKHTATLRKAQAEAHHGEYDVLLVWALDRLSREGVEATFAALRQLRQAGATVLSHEEPWVSAAGEAGDLLISITAWIAQQESARRSARMKTWAEKRRAAGLPVGRQVGAKDKGKRSNAGYLEREERKRRTRA